MCRLTVWPHASTMLADDTMTQFLRCSSRLHGGTDVERVNQLPQHDDPVFKVFSSSSRSLSIVVTVAVVVALSQHDDPVLQVLF